MALAKKQVVVLVKAYPQPSQTYQETVCCAGVTPDGQFVRLYPVRYRALADDARFDRYDTIEVSGERPRDDHRPESFHVDENSIRVVKPARLLSNEAKARAWLSRVSPSMQALRDANQSSNASLGIVKPDEGSLRFSWEAADSADEQDIAKALMRQTSLIERALRPLPKREFAFYYSWESAGKKSRHQIHDWEVQATYAAYKRRYGDQALEYMRRQYETEMPMHNLHFFMGTMKAHPRQFIVVGLLRTSIDVSAALSQASLLP